MPSRDPHVASAEAALLMGRKVHALRLHHGLTQEQLAERTGISRNQVQNIEHSRNNIKDPSTGRPGPGNARMDTVFRLADVLAVDVTYLVDPASPIDPLPVVGSSG